MINQETFLHKTGGGDSWEILFYLTKNAFFCVRKKTMIGDNAKLTTYSLQYMCRQHLYINRNYPSNTSKMEYCKPVIF